MNKIPEIVTYLILFTAVYSQSLPLHHESLKLKNLKRCDTQDPTKDDIAQSNMVMESWAKKANNFRKSTKIIVPTYFHVIIDGELGKITDDEVDQSINVLNTAYAGKIVFQLSGITNTDSSDWYNNKNYEMKMKKELRQGECNTLNVYSTSGYGTLGFASFPMTCASDKISDGVVIDSDTKPGGIFPFDGGHTLTHEVGHWLGLYHTFKDGCSGPGDYIDDTPAHAEPDFKCIAADTCPSEGSNPIDNFMNYTPDACMQKFTPNQFTRMRAMWSEYRDGSTATPTISLAPTATQIPSTPPTATWLPSLAPSDCFSLLIKIQPDDYPLEVTWKIDDKSGNNIYSGGSYKDSILYIENICINPSNCYVFTIFDFYGDGICCHSGNGFYEVYYDSELIMEGGEFDKLESSSPFGGGCTTSTPTEATTLPSISPTLHPTIFTRETMLPSLQPSKLKKKKKSKRTNKNPKKSKKKKKSKRTNKNPKKSKSKLTKKYSKKTNSKRSSKYPGKTKSKRSSKQLTETKNPKKIKKKNPEEIRMWSKLIR